MGAKVRILAGIFIVLVIALLQHYYIANMKYHSINFDDFISHPENYDGKEVEIDAITVAENTGELTIKTTTNTFEIYNANKELKKGVHGKFLLKSVDGKIILKFYRIYYYSYMKYIVSFIAIVIVGIIFLKEFKLRKRGFEYA